MSYTWKRSSGYEVSSRGDVRFSAFVARMPDGRTIEEHYQCDVKSHDPGGTNWRLGKGKPPLHPVEPGFILAAYVSLWRTWANNHPQLLLELKDKADRHGGVLSDMFAKTPVNQAHALSIILNEEFT